MRLFIGIDFNELSEYFCSLQQQLSYLPAKLSFTKTFHITLKFLNEVAPDNAEAVKSKLRQLRFDKIEVSTSAIGFFPDENYIRVVWVGIQPEEQIIWLSKNIDDALKDYFRPEKSFKPHITLVRVKFISDKENFLSSLRNIKTESKKIKLDSFCLFKSTLSPRGAIHEVLEKYC